MLVICPECRCRFSFPARGEDTDQLEYARAYRQIPKGCGRLTERYIGMFRPEQKSLHWSRAAKLTKEVAEMISTGHIQWKNKPARPCPPDVWQKALTRLTDRPPANLPLGNHNYLKTILYELADKTDAKKEYHKNAIERRGQNPDRPSEDRTSKNRSDTDFAKVEIPKEYLTKEQMQEMRKAKGLILNKDRKEDNENDTLAKGKPQENPGKDTHSKA